MHTMKIIRPQPVVLIVAAGLFIIARWSCAEPAATAQILGEVVAPAGVDSVAVMTLDPESGDFVEGELVGLSQDGTFGIAVSVTQPVPLLVRVGDLRVRLALDRPETVMVEVGLSRDPPAIAVRGSRGNELLDHFFEQLSERNGFYFSDLKQRAERALELGDDSLVRALENERDRKLKLFYGDLERCIVAMGPSSATYFAVGVLDLRKQKSIFETVAAQLAAVYPDAAVTRALSNRLEALRKVEPGRQAPSFHLQDREGGVVSLADYRGRTVLVEFWASWCLNCRAEMPRLVKLHERYAGSGFEILGITARDSRKIWQMLIEKRELGWPNLWDADAAIADAYLVKQLPARFLVDEKGMIVAVEESIDELAERLDEQFGEAVGNHAPNAPATAQHGSGQAQR